MRLPDFEKQTDASNTGIGAILLQEESGIKHPAAFASKKLLTRESHYSTIEKECLAIVWAIQKFQNFLCGKEFILETDHQPLLWPPCVADADIIFLPCDFFLSIFFYSSPNLSGLRLHANHTSKHGVALVRI